MESYIITQFLSQNEVSFYETGLDGIARVSQI